MDEDRLVPGWLVVAAILLPATLLSFLLGYWLGAIFAAGVLLHALLFYLRVLRQRMLLERQGLAREFLSAMDTTLRPVGELAAGVGGDEVVG